jgi:hypothetical protein
VDTKNNLGIEGPIFFAKIIIPKIGMMSGIEGPIF